MIIENNYSRVNMLEDNEKYIARRIWIVSNLPTTVY